MSTLENLFMQIFDRRTWIVDHQLKPQRQSYDQSLASNLLINGIRPPPWLWTSTGVGLDAEKADPGELKKEELISGLLFPPPRPPFIPLSTGQHAVYSKCNIKRDNRRLSVSSAAETCDSNQYFDVVDRSMAEPNRLSNGNELRHQCVSDCASDEVCGVDHISISHQVQTVAETSKILSEAYLLQPIPNFSFNDKVVGQSILHKVHMTNSISAFPVCKDAEISKSYFKQDQLQPKMPFNDGELGQKCNLSGVSEPNTISTSPQIQMDIKLTETISQPDQSLLRFQRSRSRQKAIENRNSAKTKTKRHSFRENIATKYTGKVKRTRSSQQPNCKKASLELKNSSDIANEYDNGATLRGSSGQLCHEDGLMNPEEPSNLAGEDEGQKEACGDVAILSDYAGNKAIQSLDGANKHYQQACTTEIAETEFFSGAAYATQSVCSELKMGSANNEVGLESVLLSPTDNHTFIEPKQLVFDHIEDYSAKPAVNSPLEEEKQETSLEVRAVSKLAAFQSSNEVSETMYFQRSNGISADQLMQCTELLQTNELVKEKEVVQADEPVLEKVLQKIEIMNGEKDAEKILVSGEGDTHLLVLDTEEADCSVSHGFPPCKTSDLTTLSFQKRKPLCTGTVPGNALASRSPVSNGMPINHAKVAVSPLQEGGGKIPFRSQLSEAAGFKQPELASKLLPAQSSEEFPVTTYLQEVNNAHSVVHDTDLSLTDKLVQEREAPQSANLIHNKEDLQNMEILNKEEQDQEALNEDQEERLQIPLSQEAKCNVFHESFSCTPSHLSTSPEKATSSSSEKVCGDASADISPARNEMSYYKAHIGIHDESFSWEDGGKNSQRSELSSPVDFHLPVAPIHTKSVSVADLKCTNELDVEPAKTLLDRCGVEGAANDVPMTSISIEFSHNSMKPSAHLEASGGGVSSVRMDLGSCIFKLDTAPKGGEILGQQGRYFLRSANSYSRDLQSSNRSHALRKSGRWSKAVHTSCETSWPTYKGRQIDYRSDMVNTSMRTRRSVPFLQQQDSFCKQSKSSVDASHVIQDFVEQPNVTTENHAAEKHLSKKRRITTVSPELSLPCSTLNVDEVDIEMKGKDQSEMVPMESKDSHDSGVRRSAVGDSTSHLEDIGKITEPTTLCDAENESMSSDALGESVRHESSEISDFAGGTTAKLKSILGQHGSFPSSGSSSYYKGPDFLGSDEALLELEGINGLLRQQGKQIPDSTEKTMEEVKAALGESSLLSCYSAGSSYYENLDLLGDDKTMPEAGVSGVNGPQDNSVIFAACERFDFHDLHYSVITKERVTGSEQLDKHCSVLTPVDCSTNHRILTLPEVCQSVPNGLLEHVDLRKACPFCWNDPKLSNDSQDNNEAERCGYASGRSFSDFIPSSSSQCVCGSKRTAFSPPPGKLCWSSSLEKQANQNPELICFRIDEDSCMNEDNGHLEEAVDSFQKRSSKKGNIHIVREALSDVSSKYQNSPQAVSTSKKFPDKGSLDSTNVETYLFETQKGDKKKLENSHGTRRKCENEGKENQILSIVENDGMALENHHNRFSRPKLSRKASRKKGSQTFSEKRCKPANIVSNISSFLPLVQHKQEMATALAGKRDIKVKALEVAEAAKRLEEKREKQRQMRKEAAKLERAKLENVKQLELKKKEEERKKKEEEIAARKRVREEEEKKEKERKRKCIEEARKQQKEREEKLRAEKEEKELRRKVDEERKRELAEEARKPQKKEKGKGGAGCIKKLEAALKPANDVMGNASHGSNSQEDPDVVKEPQLKVVNNSGNSLKLTEEHISVVGECEMSESYEISPYQGSDNEEDDDDDDVNVSQKKFIPLWARGKYLAQSLLSLKHIDPSTIFLHERCSRLSEGDNAEPCSSFYCNHKLERKFLMAFPGSTSPSEAEAIEGGNFYGHGGMM